MTRPRQRTWAELTRTRLEAAEAWQRARQVAEEAAGAQTASREARMDVTRRMEVLREQHRALVARAEQHRQASLHVRAGRVPTRAVVVHRNEWFVAKLTRDLAEQGIEVVGALENGAEGIGVVVAEQPDLLVVEDTLPMVPGVEVVREARRFAPSTLVVAQVAYEDRIPALLDAGARAAYTRRVPPADVVREVVGLLAEDRLVDA